jgi:hypothetical protein
MINALRDSIRAKVNGDYDILTRINMIDVAGRPLADSFYEYDRTSIDSMSGDDRIAYHVFNYQRQFKNELTGSFSNFFSDDYRKLVLQAINDAAGVSLPNFPSYQIIERLFRAELQRLPQICLNLIERIRNYLKESLLRIFSQTFDPQHVRLLERLKDLIIKQIDAAEDRTNERVDEILQMESRVFTINDVYMKKVNEMEEKKNAKDTEHKGEAAPPPITTTVLPPTMMQVNGMQTKSSVSGLNSTSVLVAASLMVQQAFSLTSNEALAATDIQIALDSYCLVNHLKSNHFYICHFHLGRTKTYH